MDNFEKNPPFRNITEITKGGRFMDLREVKDNPKFLIKELKPEEIEKYFGEVLTMEDLAGQINDYLKRISGLDFIPDTSLVIGSNEKGENTLFFVSERIIGKTLRSGEVLELKDKNFLEQYVKKIIQVFINTYNSKIDTGNSIEFDKINNYVRREEDGKLFLVDLFPIFKKDPYEIMENLKNFCYDLQISKENFEDEFRKLTELTLPNS